MIISNKIQEYLQKLPVSLQTEVLDYIEYLIVNSENEANRHDERAWSDLSLAAAMRGMEDEDGPNYTTSDLKVVF